ncbi:DUF4357 domain-containing protein [Martelella mediterranea]|uniref:DUF4357 domain-containing protein n=1 Tax=Martelella mediterranea DSM 17316 TaxID=1122214 RepID=A0A1U9Z096_9HYPH|nr:DUF4357 domain-containing protein [Martelella mediterranea]AQZ51121.1 hypothetical protein Mame_01776 [Martelella mediterranea DSM 17316]
MTKLEQLGRVVKIFVTGQDPRSLRTVELDNWTGVATMGKAAFFKQALRHEGIDRSCVYLLIGSGGDDDLPEIYVGESDDFSQRYASGKFPITFDTFMIFTSKDDNLTRAHVKWLERELWTTLSGNSGKVVLANANRPTGSNLPRSDIATMRTYLTNMVYLLEALGFDLFSKPERTAAIEATKQEEAAVQTPLSEIRFYTNALPKNAREKAYLVFSDGSYMLKAGSKINEKATGSLPANVRKLREGLIKSGDLVLGEGYFELQKDLAFSKPSPASALVKGRSSTGHGDWLREDDNMPLGSVLSPSSRDSEDALAD